MSILNLYLPPNKTAHCLRDENFQNFSVFSVLRFQKLGICFQILCESIEWILLLMSSLLNNKILHGHYLKSKPCLFAWKGLRCNIIVECHIIQLMLININSTCRSHWEKPNKQKRPCCMNLLMDMTCSHTRVWFSLCKLLGMKITIVFWKINLQ